MSQRSEVYQELRESIRRLGSLNGKTNTVDVIEHLDDLWANLIRTRAVMVKTLINKKVIETPKEIDPRDFLSLYLTIHDPKKDSRLCEHCCGSVEFGISECPYCGEHVNGQNSQQFMAGVVIDFDLQTTGPDWDIDTDPTEVLEKNKPEEDIDGLDYIMPITKRDDIIGPKGDRLRENKRRKFTLNRPTRDLIAWVKKRELAQHIPYSVDQLGKLSQSQLLLLVSTFKAQLDFTWPQIMKQPVSNLIRLIQGYQGDKPLDIGDPPYGELPDLEDIIVVEVDSV